MITDLTYSNGSIQQLSSQPVLNQCVRLTKLHLCPLVRRLQGTKEGLIINSRFYHLAAPFCKKLQVHPTSHQAWVWIHTGRGKVGPKIL